MSTPSTLANLFTSTLTGSGEGIKNAERSLAELQSDPNFLSNLFLISK
jgi:hypothetical protein